MRIRHWPTVAVVAQTVAVGVVYGYFVRTRPGQVRDEVALLASAMGHDKVQSVADALLHAVPVACVVAAVAVVRHLVREGRRRLAVRSVVIVLGANLTTQVIKKLAGRPDLGVGDAHLGFFNTLPSGHMAMAASVAVVVVLALPARVRAAGACLGAGGCALVGVATLAADWHRPSDVVAALLVVGAWTAASGRAGRGDAAARASAVVGAAFLTVGVVVVAAVGGTARYAQEAPHLGPYPAAMAHALAHSGLGPGPLLVISAGGAAVVAGLASLVIAQALASASSVSPAPAARTPAPAARR